MLSTAESGALSRDCSMTQNDVRASLAADNCALEIGRPPGVCPGARHQQIGNRASLKRSPDFRARPQRQPRICPLLLPESRDLTIGSQQVE
jgi:hypothetical protein